MKNIAKALILAAGVLGMTSCSDFLDQTSPSELTGETISQSTYYTGLTVNKIYGGLTQDATYSQYIPIIWGLNSDCELVDGLGDDATNATSERGNMNYNANPGWSRLAQVWDAMYGVIENANLAIEMIDASPLTTSGGTDQKTMERYKGEALTLRAMIYLDLIRFFGDIPMKLESSKSDLSNAYLEKTDRDVILDTLITDLEKAIELLPWAGEVSTYSTEHVTKGYAHALLANIALTRAGWAIREKSKEGYETASYSDPTYPTQRCDAATRKAMYELALAHLSAIITNGTHQLNPSIENQWYLLNQRQLDQTYRENIFEIPMGLGVSSELGYTVGVRINGASAQYGAKGNSSGKMKVTAPFFWSFDKKDLRRDITCCNLQLKETSGVLKEEMLGNTPFAIYVGKWDIRKMNEEWRQAAIATGNAKWMSGINVVRMRYPQVLLMYAEVMNELAGPDGGYAGSAGLTARQALSEVHCRAFAQGDKAEAESYIAAIPADKDAFFNAIVDENAWELAGEGVRKFDLIRWNLLAEKTQEFKDNYVAQMSDETNGYPEKIYFNYTDESKTVIDLSSVTWYGLPEGKTSADYDDSKDFFGKERTDATQKNLNVNLPSISSGLIGDNVTVKNRYLLPIGSTTISASNGTLYNSYGYSN
ncbi:RagB/SusD family nutrient uptake outer membrane protein [uncultured Bacteroides sp.]|uniref:RagB/SusD family nutrient uptake outer membrane protein n=1 Tax=uncultured Bacteroides sp. TaxID=162156 RepID=UPI0026101D99|nr:RagB/SusD family nutrient uptake outer membrane protein [uncultured Bacteroides sp.]